MDRTTRRDQIERDALQLDEKAISQVKWAFHGRDHTLNKLVKLLQLRHHIRISGRKGIGKSTIAIEALRELSKKKESKIELNEALHELSLKDETACRNEVAEGPIRIEMHYNAQRFITAARIAIMKHTPDMVTKIHDIHDVAQWCKEMLLRGNNILFEEFHRVLYASHVCDDSIAGFDACLKTIVTDLQNAEIHPKDGNSVPHGRMIFAGSNATVALGRLFSHAHPLCQIATPVQIKQWRPSTVASIVQSHGGKTILDFTSFYSLFGGVPAYYAKHHSFGFSAPAAVLYLKRQWGTDLSPKRILAEVADNVTKVGVEVMLFMAVHSRETCSVQDVRFSSLPVW